jgi:hypothetical protein
LRESAPGETGQHGGAGGLQEEMTAGSLHQDQPKQERRSRTLADPVAKGIGRRSLKRMPWATIVRDDRPPRRHS